jgi:hypothetical protein
MNLNNLESTNDLTVKEFRDLAKTLRSFRDVKEDVILNAFKQNSQINPSEMFDFFIENGLLEKGILTEQQEQTWSATLPLRAIAGASLQKRKTSDKAWNEVAKAFARIVCLSDNLPWVIHSPSKLFLFGSMLDPNKKDYGDADLDILSLVWEKTKEKTAYNKIHLAHKTSIFLKNIGEDIKPYFEKISRPLEVQTVIRQIDSCFNNLALQRELVSTSQTQNKKLKI